MKNIPNISFQSIEQSNDFECLNLTDLFARMPDIIDHNPTQPHRISFFALVLVTKGSGTHQIDLKTYNIQPGSVLKIAKGQVHAFQKNALYEGYIIIFTEDFVVNHFSKSSINMISHLYNYHITSPIFSNEAGNKIFLDQLILEVQNENNYAKENIVAALLNLYLLRLEREFNDTLAHNNSNHYAIFIRFKNLVEADYTSTRNVKDYATKLFISTKQLNQVVKEFTLNTAKNFIDDFVLLEIKRAMVSSNTSLKEIAFLVGFDELTNFTKFFKKHTNLTPKEFKTLL
ncbi:helix-turn-helix domain-containing protein [Flavobacterium algicola]|uniref:helix-turn-helix domain-containing protein n=1 Tax=Flavobacterium algicola TaxID=556529 RepID=UPI001EFDC45A|nr:helix-turn-helix transcriptional regulator [Flavobacterium algicola]MCG9791880.1 AraC family transcriptional regulator [Flavobacterium algicola]